VNALSGSRFSHQRPSGSAQEPEKNFFRFNPQTTKKQAYNYEYEEFGSYKWKLIGWIARIKEMKMDETKCSGI